MPVHIPMFPRLAASQDIAAFTPSTSLAFDPGQRPPASAHVAEDPLRAYPAPLGDMGLPTAFGPVRLPDMARASVFNSVLRANLSHPHGSPPPAASSPLMPSASLRSSPAPLITSSSWALG